MKTPSFLELKSLVEYLAEELAGAQLQEVISTEDGLVGSFYRFTSEPRLVYLAFDIDKPYPFLGYFNENPWPKQKKTKPLSLFLNAHAKNLIFNKIEITEALGRVIKISLGQNDNLCEIEFRLIPKQTNLIVRQGKKSISWYPVKELGENDLKYTQNEEDVRSIAFMMKQWALRRGRLNDNTTDVKIASQSPFEKWKKNKEKDLDKKTKALVSVQNQINQYETEEWSEVGEYLKSGLLKNIKPEWSVYIDFTKSASENMQKCFEKSKAAIIKINGARNRLVILNNEILNLANLTKDKFEEFLNLQNQNKNKPPARKIEGRLRKMLIEESGLVAYLGRSAADNMSLLRKSKPYDVWLHLKDYPSAHAIIHKQKDQKISDSDIKKIATWLIKDGLSDKKNQIGGKYSVVFAECRHVKPIKGDKLGRVTHQNTREILIAI